LLPLGTRPEERAPEEPALLLRLDLVAVLGGPLLQHRPTFGGAPVERRHHDHGDEDDQQEGAQLVHDHQTAPAAGCSSRLPGLPLVRVYRPVFLLQSSQRTLMSSVSKLRPRRAVPLRRRPALSRTVSRYTLFPSVSRLSFQHSSWE